jgi:hypothetical protein
MTIRDTRFPELGYARPLKEVWRVIDKSTGCGVGPLYKTRAELLADLDRFAVVFGCSPAPAGKVVS